VINSVLLSSSEQPSPTWMPGPTFARIFAGHGVFAIEGPARFTLMTYQTA
jgi:hypothetical protein